MAEIHIIYGHQDEDHAARLVELLSRRWTVWWDKLVKQRFVDEIHEELRAAKCALVLWSATSRVKDTVVDEVRLAQKHNVPIVSASLDGSDPAYGFGGYVTVDLSAWSEEENHAAFSDLFARLVANLPPSKRPVRPTKIANGRLPLPSLFLSVSSFETQLVPHGAVKALALARAPMVLVSAWDLVTRRKPQALIEALFEYRTTGGFILLDSGNYEASRLTAKRWSASDLEEVFRTVAFDWAFCFDKMKAQPDPERTAEQIVAIVKRDQALTDAPILPVVHAPRLKSGGYKSDIIPAVTRLVAEALQPPMIGIPERELGAGISQRIVTMQGIRHELDRLPFYQPVHLLGTGNPWTVAIMAAAGADSFDGLEWCRTVVDHETDRLNHFQHFDLFTDQTRFADLAIASDALDDPGIEFAGRVAFHNIDYFLRFGAKLREMVMKDRLESFVTARLGKAAAEMLQRLNPGVFET
ncbi:MAG: toll/interleukin-1 receptor domain-containing protein [Pseudorhodobacter sp.]|nr:toll/interleukin-1 receptor domain-containing protein [Pseudorhodobacter sp.]